MATSYIDAVLRLKDQMTAPLRKAADALESTRRKNTAVGKDFKKVGGVIAGVGKGITKYISVPAVTALGASMKVSMSFNKQMSRVQAISGSTGKSFQALRKQAIDLGAKTQYSATQAAEGMENLASAGFNSKQIMAAMPGLLNLAASSGESLADSSDIAASAINGFGLKASSASHVADVLAKNAAKTNAQVRDTGEALKYVAPLAKTAGISMEETTAAIGIMANAGIKGSQAGTTLRGALTRLMKPTKQVDAGLEKLGVNVYNKQGKMKSLTTIIGDLKTATKGMTDEEKQNALANIFGTNAMSGMMALVNAGPKQLSKLTKSYKNSGGAASKMAAQMQNNLAGSLTKLKSALKSAGISIGDALTPSIQKITKWITKMVAKFNSLSPATKRVVAHLLVFAAAIGPIILGFGKLIIFIGRVKRAFGILGGCKTFIMMLHSPILIIIAAVAALIAVLVLVVKRWKQIKAVFQKVANYIIEKFGALKAVVSGWANSAVAAFEWVKDKASALADTIKKKFTDAFSFKGFGKNFRMPGNANGTSNWQGGLTWVGENGPELINLPRGTEIHDARKSRRMAIEQRQTSGNKNVTVIVRKIADNVTLGNKLDVDDFTDMFVTRLETLVGDNVG